MTNPTPPSETANAIAEPVNVSDGTGARIAQLEAENERLRALAGTVRRDLEHDCVGRCAPIGNRPGEYLCTERDGLVQAVIDALAEFDRHKGPVYD